MNLLISRDLSLLPFLLIPFLLPGADSRSSGAQPSPADPPGLALQLGHSESIESMAFSQDGILATGGGDNTVRLWDAARGQVIRIINKARGPVAFSPDGGALAFVSAREPNGVQIIDPESGRSLGLLPGTRGPLAFSPDGGVITARGDDHKVWIWETRTWKLRAKATEPMQDLTSLAFFPDSTAFATVTEYGTLRLWDTQTGKLKTLLRDHIDTLPKLAVSRDGKTVISGGIQGLRLWDVSSGQLKGDSKGFDSSITSVAISPDGKSLAASWGGNAGVFEINSGNALLRITGQTYSVDAVAFSPDGTMLATASYDAVTLWHVGKREAIRTLPGHRNIVLSISFSPDGKTLASASMDERVRLWQLQKGRVDMKSWRKSSAARSTNSRRHQMITSYPPSPVLGVHYIHQSAADGHVRGHHQPA